jgi:cytochrome b561
MTDAILTSRKAVVATITRPAPAAVQSDVAAPAYSPTARILHWGMAVLILATIPIGVVISNDWGGRLQDALYDLHKSIGVLLFALALVRLAYRLMRTPLPLPDDIPRLQQAVAHATHWGLYVLLLLQPIVGWAATSAYGAPIVVFGWFKLPPIYTKNLEIAELLFSFHRLIGVALTGLIAMHIAGALFHHFVRKDRVLMRMLTG